MKKIQIYLFFTITIGILGCSENALDNSDTYSEIGVVVSNFIPTIESWNSLPHTSVEWKHEFSSNGLLTKSTMLEKYPNRVLWELRYFNHNDDQLPLEYEKTYFSFGEQVNMINWDVRYTLEGTIEALTAFKNGSYSHEYIFTALDEKKRVKSALYFDSTGEFVDRTIYEYDEDGNHKRATLFSSEFGSEDILGKWEWYYNHFGDRYFTLHFNMETGATTEFTYTYRPDFTLNNKESVTVSEGSPDLHYLTEFDKEERPTYQRVTYGEQRWEYVSYFPNGDVETLEYYFRDVKVWVQTYQEDRTSIRKIFDYENGTYRIEYRDSEGTVFKIEFYDSNDNLLNTEYSSMNAPIEKQMKSNEIKNNLSFDNLYGENL